MSARHVVLVEDEPQIRRFVRVALEEEGCQVFEAETVERGLIEAGTRKPDLVIVDLGLPDRDGLELIRDLRGWSNVPVIVLSARSGEADKIAALDLGADDYLTKPFGVGEMLARVRAALRRSARNAESGEHGFVWRRRSGSRQSSDTKGWRGGAPHPHRIPFALLPVHAQREGLDAPATAQTGVGALARRAEPLSANLHAALAAETRR